MVRPVRPSLALAAGLLVACASSRPPAAVPATSAPAAAAAPAAAPASPASPTAAVPDEAPPLLQLPGDVHPVRYALRLELDPARDAGFRGQVEIQVVLDRPRQTVWLHGNALRVTAAAVVAGAERLPATWRQVTPSGVARLDLPRAVGPGPVTLRLAWEAPWGGGRGAARYGKAPERFVATQHEPVDARRVFPGFDEPRFKTPFEVTVDAPADLLVVSNASEEGAEAAGSMRRVRFAATDPLPTYLVFVAVGPFETVDATLPPNGLRKRPLPVRFVVPRGRGGDVAFAREAGSALLVELERYFGMPFPYPKLDQLAIPGFLVGGMENAGAIAYRSELLLRNAATDGPLARLGAAEVLAHEMAHQWFGDLVTPAWWTDIWLNESFATWMGIRAVQRWRPELGAELAFQEDAALAFRVDALGSTRAIRKPLDRMEDVESQFDLVSYQKGAAVLAMFERWLGEDRFQDGIRRYLAARPHGTGSTSALLADLSIASGRDVAGPLETFLDRPGAPLVEARTRCEAGRGRLLLSQSRSVPRGSAAAQDGTWQVPVCVRWSTAGREDERCVLLAAREASVDLPGGCPDWIFPNAGAAGYYRVALSPEDLARVRARALPRLSAPERVALAGSIRAAQQSGALPYADALDALGALAGDPEPAVAAQGMAALSFAHDRLVTDALRPAVAARMRALYRPALDRLGWNPRPGEPPQVREHRAALVALLARVGADPAVRREAARRGAAWLGLPDGTLHADAVSPDLAAVAAEQAIRARGAPAFDAAAARLAASRDPQVRMRLVRALASTEDPALDARALSLLRSDDLDPRERIVPLRQVLADAGPGVRDRLLDALVSDVDGFARGMGFFTAQVPAIAAGACRAEDADRLEAAVRPKLEAYPEMAVSLARTAESIRVCAAEREAERGPAAAYFGRR
ncbi:M1 family metallopeptidase [Anaeromyxobacter oryzae]|uniref:Aminopeptidase n=1 Tax=Anaeromyxobacter oryzae TaxID=2918170 RepID=A0ABM7WQE5_9BACT|nr:M1 family aminopeptidase [Anaeromyxobacter oryzae]BDG01684.1 aminopeptidase [Anaeromyxobacter oryzae]